jgi:hypothetical protein
MYDPLRYFEYDHLKDERMRSMSKRFYHVACELATMPDNTVDQEQVEVALRHLLIAKDAAVRAVLP